MNIEGLTKGEMFIWEWQYRTHGSFNEGLAKILSIADGKNHKRLAKGFPDEAEAMAEYSKESDESAAPSTLGDLLKQQMDKD